MADLDYQYIGKLVTQAQAGDSNAFAELYAATYQKQYKFAYNYLKDTFLAQDAIQETYILVLKHLDKLKEPSVFISWLGQINFRVCFDILRKQDRFNSELTETGEQIHTQAVTQGPESEIVRIDEQKYIVKQLLSLPFAESQAIILKYYNNLKLDEIAKLMNCSKSTVKRHLNSGYDRLRQKFT